MKFHLTQFVSFWAGAATKFMSDTGEQTDKQFPGRVKLCSGQSNSCKSIKKAKSKIFVTYKKAKILIMGEIIHMSNSAKRN